MASCVTGKNRGSDRRNLEQNVEIHQDQQYQQRKLCDQRGYIQRHEARVVQRVQMPENRQYRGCNHLVEAEANERPLPSPKYEAEFFIQKEKDINRSVKCDHSGSDFTVRFEVTDSC